MKIRYASIAIEAIIIAAAFNGCAEIEPVLEKKDTTARVTWVRVWHRQPGQEAYSLFPYNINYSLSIDCRPKVSNQKIDPIRGSAEGGQWFFRWPSICPDSGIEISDIEIVPSINICDPRNEFFPEKKLGEFIDITLKCEDGKGVRR